MALLIPPQNNNPAPISLPGDLPAPTHTRSSEDFLSRAIKIVRTGVQEGDVDQIEVPLQALRAEYAREALPSTTCRALVEQIKDTDVCIEHLPTIYRHLILDLGLQVGDLSTCNEEFRIAKAKLVALEPGEGISASIQKYGITNQAALVEIAKIAATQNALVLSRNIKNFGIKTEAARIEIAKIAAQQRSVLGIHILNFDITNQEALIEIAKLSAQQSGLGISRHIQEYGIKNQTTLIEIAKIAAHQSGGGVSLFIQDYSIENQEALIEIAKIAAEQNGLGMSDHIQKYGIQSEEALVEIALLAIQQSEPTNAIKILNKYNLSTESKICILSRLVNSRPEVSHEINEYFSKMDPSKLLKQYPELRVFGFSPNTETGYLVEMVKLTDPFTERRKTLYCETTKEQDPTRKAIKKTSLHVLCSIVDFASGSPSLLKKLSDLFSAVQQEKSTLVQEQKLTLIAALLMHCRAKNVDQRALDKQFFLLNGIFALTDTSLRTYLSHLFIDQVSNPDLCSLLSSKKLPVDLVMSLLLPFITQIDTPYVELRFAAKKQSVSEIDPEMCFVSFIDRLKELLNHKFFKDTTKLEILLSSLHTLIGTPQLTHAEKLTVLRDLIFVGHPLSIKGHFKQDQCEQLLRSAEMVALLINSDQSTCLMSISSGQLHDQFQSLFAKILKIEPSGTNPFAAWRKPGSLLKYASKLQSSLEIRETVFPFLQEFAKAVINGTFAFDRYDPSKAPVHWLNVLKMMSTEQIEKWKRGNSYSDAGMDVVDTDNPCDLLLSGTDVGSCQRVQGDPHFSKCLVAYLIDPKIRMMAVKNKQGVIIARCMMRLLWDKTAMKFVLFQEKKYPMGGDVRFAGVLDRACKKRAEELGLALLIKEEGGEQTTLQAFKGKAPFEYVDAHEDPIQTDVGYEISGCKYIYQPDNFRSTQ